MSRDPKNLGQRSIKPSVRIRPDKPHGLKSHFSGCLREIIGIADKLAANDPERFVFAGPKFLQQHAGRKDGAGYSPRQVMYTIAQAERLGIFQPDAKERQGRMCGGWIVKAHEDIAAPNGSSCVTRLLVPVGEPRAKHFTRRRPGQADGRASAQAVVQEDAGALQDNPGGVPALDMPPIASPIASSNSPIASCPSPIASPIASWKGSDCITDCIPGCIMGEGEQLENKGIIVLKEETWPTEVLQKGHAEPGQPLSQPMTEPLEPGNGHTSASRESDLTSRPGPQTIGLVFAFGSCPPAEDICLASDREFDTAFLKDYKHGKELQQCIWAAYDELAEEPYLGRASNARLMGRAMELMRERHSLDVPAGWVPVMRKLRGKAAPAKGAK